MTEATLRLVPLTASDNNGVVQEAHVVEVTSRLAEGQLLVTNHYLDGWLGNNNGNFSTTGANFSLSSKDLCISNKGLYANLRTVSGQWETCRLVMRANSVQSGTGWTQELVIGDDHDRFAPTTVLPSMILELGDPLGKLELQGNSLLRAECLYLDAPAEKSSRSQTSSFDLNAVLGNHNGAFAAGGRNFSASARNVRLIGIVLRAELRTVAGEWKLGTISLQQLVSCSKARIHATNESWLLRSRDLPLRMHNAIRSQQAISAPLTIYTPLKDCNADFRVCYIEPGKWTDPIRCKMLSRPIDDKESYKCLSYVWGTTEENSTIQLNSHDFSVTRNLFTILRRLRWHGTTGPLWVDAMCINQKDNAEKGAQVSNMGAIYAMAQEVIIWIETFHPHAAPGLECETLARALATFVRRLASDSHLQGAADEAVEIIVLEKPQLAPKAVAWLVAQCTCFTESAWFERSWTLQEYLFAGQPVFAFGAEVIRVDTLKQATHNLFRHLRTCCDINHMVTGVGRIEGPRAEQLRKSRTNIHDWLSDLTNKMLLTDDLGRLRKYLNTLPTTDAAHYMEAVLVVLQQCRRRRSSDARDKLWAFSNIASRGFEFIGLKADYAMSAKEAFVQFTFKAIESSQNLDVWVLVQQSEDLGTTEVEDLPSWAVDWTYKGPLPWQTHIMRASNAPAPFPTYSNDASVASLQPDYVLRVQGMLVDTVGRTLDNLWRCSTDHAASRELMGRSNLLDFLKFLGLSTTEERSAKADLWDRFRSVMTGGQFPTSADSIEFYSTYEVPYHRWRVLSSGDKDLFDEWVREELGHTGEEPTPVLPDHLWAVPKLIHNITEGRKLFHTIDDRVGLCPPGVRAGDALYAIAGSRWPVILRQCPGQEHESHEPVELQLVGTCYMSNFSEDFVREALSRASNVDIR